MSVDDQAVPEPTGAHQGPAEALRQIARDMAKAYEVALEVNPQLYFSGRTPAVVSAHTSAERA
ncbi:hypothetical protein [Micromonospora robiginosa]|uniref:Uncharacterized protein n=1 Tax=Micromonospora robiginosa TaxID=2749844 RepID=A0A7L6B6D0_9ACTN|nr:hypothetical protein [Micromonospora ferruginea]QLQ37517.1 hypothetical protein H1D33_00975 [Micromonospora ferruginea]